MTLPVVRLEKETTVTQDRHLIRHLFANRLDAARVAVGS